MPAPPDEGRISDALTWYHQNPSERSIREAAERFGIKRSTLQNRANGTRKPRKEAHQDQQLLLPAEEEELANTVLAHADRGFPVRIPDIRRWDLEIARCCDLNITSVGEKWHERFLKRQPEIQMRWRQNMDRT